MNPVVTSANHHLKNLLPLWLLVGQLGGPVAAQPALLLDLPSPATAQAVLVASPAPPGLVRQSRRVGINPAALPKASGTRASLNLFPGTALVVEWERQEILRADNSAWHGQLVDDPLSVVTLTRLSGEMVLEVNSPMHGLFEVSSRGGDLAEVVEWDPAVIKANGHCAVVDTAAPNATQLAAPAALNAAAFAPTTVDVLVVYTPECVGLLTNRAAVVAKAQAGINAENGNFTRSLVVHKMRLVHTRAVNYTGSGSLLTDLNWTQASSEVAAIRNEVGADIVALLSDKDNNNTLGIANMLANTNGQANNAFSANFYSTFSGVWPHELGHNLGCAHNDTLGETGLYPYSFGHFWTDGATQYGTMMSYVGQRIAWFSNPSVSRNGFPTGVTDARDNVLTMNNSGPVVAAYRASKLLVDAAVGLTSSTSAPVVGQNFNLTLWVTNKGPDTATSAQLQLSLPSGVAHVSNTGGGAFAPATGLWMVPSLAANASTSLTVVVQAGTATAAQPLTLTAQLATIGTGFTDFDYYNNTASRSVTPVTLAPLLDNADGAFVGANFARLDGTLNSTGAAPTVVQVLWGPNDGGTNRNAWTNSAELGLRSVGTFRAPAFGLTTGTTYYYRSYASNAFGEAWAPASATFVPRDYSRWTNRLKIDFAYAGAETLTNFPALVILNTNRPGFNYSQFASASGTDLRFVDAHGGELAYELDTWNPTGDSLVWVRLPRLDTGTWIQALWGNPAATTLPAYATNGSAWDSAAAAVWHLDENLAGTGTLDGFKDSTANLNHGNDQVTANDKSGMIGLGQAFNGTNDYVDPTVVTPGLTNSFTVAFWCRPLADHQIDAEGVTGTAGTSGQKFAIDCTQGGTNANVGVSVGRNGVSVYEHGNSYLPAVLVWPGNLTNQWTQVAVVYSNQTPRLYVNGLLKRTGQTSPRSYSKLGLVFGGRTYGFFEGNLDEVRMDTVARSADWVQACWKTQGDHEAFTTYTPAPPLPGPYGGVVRPLPGVIQVEDFDGGGPGVAYADSTLANNGATYRPNEAVDLQNTTDTGGGRNLGWTTAGEWLEYLVNSQLNATFTLGLRVAATSPGGKVQVEVDGVDRTGLITITNTGGNQVWTTTIVSNIALTTGLHLLRLSLELTNGLGSVGNYNWLEFTAPNQAPILGAISNRTLIAGQTLTLTNLASDFETPPQVLTFSLLAPPAGADVNASNGIFHWRPTIAQSPFAHSLSVKVVDNGSPNLSATQSFLVTVTQPARPVLSEAAWSNGDFHYTIAGDNGPDYTILASTNLTAWLPVWTNSSPWPPFTFTDTTVTNVNQRFYRVLLGP